MSEKSQGEVIADGGRNAALASLAGSMRRRGMTPEAIEAALLKDDDALRVLTKNSRETCAEPRISIIGHITNTELQRLLSESDAANGFANRFLWVLCAEPVPADPAPDR